MLNLVKLEQETYTNKLIRKKRLQQRYLLTFIISQRFFLTKTNTLVIFEKAYHLRSQTLMKNANISIVLILLGILFLFALFWSKLLYVIEKNNMRTLLEKVHPCPRPGKHLLSKILPFHWSLVQIIKSWILMIKISKILNE
jgi:hypothetical protein